MSSFGRILIVGSRGQVGRELQRNFSGSGELLCYDRHNVDLGDPEQVRAMVRDSQPDLILNAAAYTAVDRAESEPELAIAINATAPRVLADEAERRNILLVHYSTDYVFDGSKREPWLEIDQPNPLNVYGVTKLAGENAVRAAGKHLIFRTSWIYGPHGNNFLLTMLRLASERDTIRVVDDQIGAPTTSGALADATFSIVIRVLAGHYGSQQDWSGLYHMTCTGATSWFGFAREILERTSKRSSISAKLLPITTPEYPTPAARPLYSVLSNQSLKDRFGMELPRWQDALSSVLLQLS